MKANFHTHTTRCHHATGEDREYVLSAIENGLETLGFSDHSPYLFSDGYVSHFRMTPEESLGYVKSVRALAEEFSDKIKIYLGYEIEYYPKFFENTVNMIKNNGCDYLILGQHYLGNEMGSRCSAAPSESTDELQSYVDALTCAMASGHIFYVAHPDVLNFTGDIDFYREQMTRLCAEAKKYKTPLELNLLGLREGRFYPVEEFWKIVAKTGNEVIFGCDAHRPCDVASAETVDPGYRMADKFGLNVIEPKKPYFLK
ncbi:MAG: histidinol-phosphatase [Clostridiales bacterium]|nr:histidinol-phosphatase [Clostridiales bacterium]